MNVKGKIDHALYKQLWAVALPIVLQNLLDAAVNSADVVMLNFVGQDALSAVSLANQFGSVIFMLFYGVGTGVAMLSAQYWGKGDVQTIEKVEGIGLRFSLSAGMLVTALCLGAPQLVMKIFTDDAALVRLGCVYLRIWAPSLILWSFCSVYTSVLRCTGRAAVGTAIEGAALLTNVLLNAVFIFGLLGAPRLGVAGVALATTLSRGIQLLCCLLASSRSGDVKLRVAPIFGRYPALFRDFLTMALPAVANDLSWSLAFSMYSVILGHLGNDAVAANSMVTVVRNLGSVLCFAVASAAGIILGQILGENDIERAKRASRTLLRLTIAAGAVGGALVFAITPLVMRAARLSETALDYLHFMLRVTTVYIIGGAVNTVLIAGVFRAGGDSRFGFICDTIDMWGYAVPLGFLAAFVFKLPVKAVYLLMCTDEFVKWPWVFKHYYSGKWAKNITRSFTP